MYKWLAMLLVAAWAAAPAAGDTVYLKNGGSVEGDVTQTADGVTVKLPAGQMSFRNDQIDRIEKGPSAISEFGKRLAAVKDDDAEGHYKLGLWARGAGLEAHAVEEFQKAVALKPDYADARIALGQRLVDGQWLTEDQQMAARGLVKYEGQWMTPEAVAKLKTLRAELQIAQQKNAAAQAELQRTQEQLQTPQQAAPTYGYNPYDNYYQNRPYSTSPGYYYGYPYTRSYSFTPYSHYILPGYSSTYRYRLYSPGFIGGFGGGGGRGGFRSHGGFGGHGGHGRR